jgi:hypothetical protein
MRLLAVSKFGVFEANKVTDPKPFSSHGLIHSGTTAPPNPGEKVERINLSISVKVFMINLSPPQR